jgi:hypothetical protein
MKPIQIIALAALSIIPAPVRAQDGDFWTYLQKHASFVGGVVVVDDEKQKLVELRIVDDFAISGKFRGAFRLGLFSITRAGEQAPVNQIPTSLEQVKAYSDGEAWLSVYRTITPGIAIECTGGLAFKMVSITGQVGDPLDGTKLAGVCGPRFEKDGYQVSVLGGHFGPVTAGGKIAGPVPSILIHAYIPLKFLGKSTAFVPDLAFGATPDPLNPAAARSIARTLRLGIATRF